MNGCDSVEMRSFNTLQLIAASLSITKARYREFVNRRFSLQRERLFNYYFVSFVLDETNKVVVTKNASRGLVLLRHALPLACSASFCTLRKTGLN